MIRLLLPPFLNTDKLYVALEKGKFQLFYDIKNNKALELNGGITEFGNSEMLKYSPDEDQVIKIGEINVCEIIDNKCKMIKATCPKQIYTNQKAIYKKGQSIICLPNKVVIEVKETDNMR